jgi:hypothetical protein
MGVFELRNERRWSCPNCGKEEVTHEAQPHTRFHECPHLHGLAAPMLPAGTRALVRALPREDYVGREHVTRDSEGRPAFAVETVRDDGVDVAVFAPMATAFGEA